MNDKNILSIYEGGVDDYVTNYDEDSDWDDWDSDYYDYYDYYDDYLPSDRHWSEDDSDWNSEYEDSDSNSEKPDSNSEKPECDFSLPGKTEEVDVCKEISIVENSSIASPDKDLVAEKLKTLASNITCVVCLANKIQILCEPCGHLVICGKCLQGLKDRNCPFCRTKIYKTIIVTLP